MRTKVIIFIGAVALVTLSFTFGTVRKPMPEKVNTSKPVVNAEPIGGLYADIVE